MFPNSVDEGHHSAKIGWGLRTFLYNCKRRYESEGINGLANMGNRDKATWNRLTLEELAKVFEVARNHPELSCRLLAEKITEEEAFTISEATVYRLLKAAGLVCPRPVTKMENSKLIKVKTHIDRSVIGKGVILIHIPKLVCHGFKCISESESILINVPTELYNYKNPDEYCKPPHDSDIPYDWSRKDG